MKETPSGKYLAILALAAIGILFVGVRFRPREKETDEPSPMETAMLQQIVQREQAAGIGQYLAGRAAELANQAVFLPERRTSGIRYQSPGKILTIGGAELLVEPTLAVVERTPEAAPAPIVTRLRNPDHWMLIIGRSAKNQPLWTAGIQGASRSAACNGVPYQELVLNSALDQPFAGAGAFDLNGALIGIVMPCDGGHPIVSIASVPALLAASAAPEREFVETYGFHATPLSEKWRDLYPRLAGFLVTDVWIGGWADRNGLLPGDLIVSDEKTVTTTNLIGELKVARAGRAGYVRIKVGLPDAVPALAVLPARPALPVLRVEPGTSAYLAGLRTGDRLVSVPGKRDASLAGLSSALVSAGAGPIRLIYERGRKLSLAETGE